MLKRQYYINRLAEDIRRCREIDTDPASEIRIGRRKFISNCISQILYEIPYINAGFSFEPMAGRLKTCGISDENITIKPRREYEIHIGSTTFTIKMRFDSRYGQHSKLVLAGEPDEFDITDKNAEDVADAIIAIAKSYDQWNSEWESIADEALKLSKQQDVERMSLETLVASKLKGSGIEYRIEHGKSKSTLSVKAGNRKISIGISHRRLVETCRNLLSELQEIIENLDKIPADIEIDKLSQNEIWTKS